MRWLGIGLIALAAVLSGFYLSQVYFNEPLPTSRLSPGGVRVDMERPDFRLGSISGEFVSASDYDGDLLLLNFWATWCEPCRREMPMLMEFHDQYAEQGLEIVGIALDDVQKARDFANEYGIGYTILVGGGDVMQTSHAYGNVDGVLPYSVLVDRQGVIRWQYIGEIPRAEFINLLQAYL